MIEASNRHTRGDKGLYRAEEDATLEETRTAYVERGKEGRSNKQDTPKANGTRLASTNLPMGKEAKR
jgi:hypothetical protein